MKIFHIAPKFRDLFDNFPPTFVDRIVFIGWKGQTLLGFIAFLVGLSLAVIL